jgi:hypothetical protein
MNDAGVETPFCAQKPTKEVAHDLRPARRGINKTVRHAVQVMMFDALFLRLTNWPGKTNEHDEKTSDWK